MKISERKLRKLIKETIISLYENSNTSGKNIFSVLPTFKIDKSSKSGPSYDPDAPGIPYYEYKFSSNVLSNPDNIIVLYFQNNLTLSKAESIVKECLKYCFEYFSSKRVNKFLLDHEEKGLEASMKLNWYIQIGPFKSYSSAGDTRKYSAQKTHYMSIQYTGGSIKSAIESNKHEIKHIIANSANLDLDKIQSESDKENGNVTGMAGENLKKLDESLHLHLNETIEDYKNTARHFLKQLGIKSSFKTYKKGFLSILRKYIDYSTEYLEVKPKEGADRLKHMHNESHRAGVKVRSLYKVIQDKNPDLVDDKNKFKLEFEKLLNFEYDKNIYFNDRDVLRTLLAMDINKIKENASKLSNLYEFADNSLRKDNNNVATGYA